MYDTFISMVPKSEIMFFSFSTLGFSYPESLFSQWDCFSLSQALPSCWPYVPATMRLEP